MSKFDQGELEKTAHKRWNIGCGNFPLAYFTNVDSDPNIEADVHATIPPIPAETESLDQIWACHFLEHLGPGEAQIFLREAHRCLVPGGRLGIVVPDTKEVMRRYLAGALDCVEYPYRQWHAVKDLDDVCALFLYSTVQESPHKWSYDMDTLARALARAGFVGLREIDRYRDGRIATGQWYQFGLDCFKPKPKDEGA